MRAISAFSFEAGTSSFWWRARIALRIRARKSATGSVKLMLSPSSSVRSGPEWSSPENQRRWSSLAVLCTPKTFNVAVGRLPGRLHNARNLAAQRETAETQTAHAEFAQEPARAAAQLAAVVLARGKLRLSCVLDSFCSGRHLVVILLVFLRAFRRLSRGRAERHAKLPQQRARLVVVL